MSDQPLRHYIVGGDGRDTVYCGPYMERWQEGTYGTPVKAEVTCPACLERLADPMPHWQSMTEAPQYLLPWSFDGTPYVNRAEECRYSLEDFDQLISWWDSSPRPRDPLRQRVLAQHFLASRYRRSALEQAG